MADHYDDHYDGMAAAYLDALREFRLTARQLALLLGQSTSRGNVAAIRAFLGQMERKGLVTRTRKHKTWIWMASDG
jgi:hypothetical protein